MINRLTDARLAYFERLAEPGCGATDKEVAELLAEVKRAREAEKVFAGWRSEVFVQARRAALAEAAIIADSHRVPATADWSEADEGFDYAARRIRDALRALADAPGTEAPRAKDFRPRPCFASGDDSTAHPADCACSSCVIRMGGSLED